MKALVYSTLLFAVSWLCIGSNASGQPHLLINEIQVANIDQFIDYSFNYGSWMELYNPSDTKVSLKDLIVRHTDSEGTVTAFKLNIRYFRKQIIITIT